MASWKEPWPCRAVQQPRAYTTGNDQGCVSPALSTGWTLLRGSIAQPSVLLELVPKFPGWLLDSEDPRLTSGALLSWGWGSPDPPPPPDTLAAGSRQAAGPAASSVAPGGCDLAASRPLWAGSWAVPLQVKWGVCKSPSSVSRSQRCWARVFLELPLPLSLSALLASVLDLEASAAPTCSPPQPFPVAGPGP